MSFTSILLLLFAILSIASNVIGYIALPKDDASKSRRQFIIFMISLSCLLTVGSIAMMFMGGGGGGGETNAKAQANANTKKEAALIAAVANE
jgi:flagellar basal body-associated protein FliL